MLHSGNVLLTNFTNVFSNSSKIILKVLLKKLSSCSTSIRWVIRNPYRDTVVDLARKLEKVDFKCGKVTLDLNSI